MKHEPGKSGRRKLIIYFYSVNPRRPFSDFSDGRGGCTLAIGTRDDVFLTFGNAEACDDLNWSIDASLSLFLYCSL